MEIERLRCTKCSRLLEPRSTVWLVHQTSTWRYVLPEVAEEEGWLGGPDDQGLFPSGPECARLLSRRRDGRSKPQRSNSLRALNVKLGGGEVSKTKSKLDPLGALECLWEDRRSSSDYRTADECLRFRDEILRPYVESVEADRVEFRRVLEYLVALDDKAHARGVSREMAHYGNWHTAWEMVRAALAKFEECES